MRERLSKSQHMMLELGKFGVRFSVLDRDFREAFLKRGSEAVTFWKLPNLSDCTVKKIAW